MAGRKKKEVSLSTLKRRVAPLIDTRATDDNGVLIQRDRKVTVIDIFGTEQRAAVAYYVSDLLAKGFNNQQIIVAIKDKYDLTWSMRQLNVVKELLKRIWRAEMAHEMGDQIAREVATIDTQLKETWEAWEFSKKGIKHNKKRTEKSSSDAPEMNYNLEEIINEENITAGDIKFMQHINELGKEKRKLLGLYAPEKKENQGGGNTAIQLNIVGDGASQDAASVMRTILNMGNPQPIPVQEAQVVEEAKPESAEQQQMNMDIDKFMQDLLDD
jgi:DNA repair ATPase RecN